MKHDNRLFKPAYFFVITVAAIFLAEAFVMLLLPHLPIFSTYNEVLIDTLLLTILVLPLLYPFLFRPMMYYVKAQDLAEEEP